MRSIRLSATLRPTPDADRNPLPARRSASAWAEAASACIVASRTASAGPSSHTQPLSRRRSKVECATRYVDERPRSALGTPG
eukprot:scaffold34921_cov236-Isochrysis_galbana.AAC.8